MKDYIFRFPSKQIAEQFALANNFAEFDECSGSITPLLESEYCINEIGPHNGENYWILFRDLVGIPIPAGGEAFIYWASDWSVLDEDGQEIPIPRPEDDPDVPNVFWA
ncbi:MAG: hypothetical protein ACK5H0_10415 [Bacteroidota bacterium]|jgi:hypothetical protein